jgi:hypothetical protein
MGTFTVRVNNPIVETEVMVIQTDNEAIALSEAAYYSRRYGIARVYDDSLNREVARFRYGVAEVSAKKDS